jgi:hypothetical protein
MCYTPSMAKRRPARSGYSSHPIPLIARRIEIEAHLAALLKQSGSGATVEQFKKFTYEKGSVIPFGDYVSLAFREFPTLRRDVDIDTRLSVLTDAWGYCSIPTIADSDSNRLRTGNPIDRGQHSDDCGQELPSTASWVHMTRVRVKFATVGSDFWASGGKAPSP